MSNSNDLFPDLRDPFVSAIAIGTGISSCLSDVIKESLLNARKIGQKQLEDFVKDRLVLKDEEQSPKIPLRTPISKNNPLTMASIYNQCRSIIKAYYTISIYVFQQDV
jgi:hypothetical protein